MKKQAFTLAEVLITLGVIGIVAALTMPALIANYQKKQTITQLKKAYSILSQAISLASLDNDVFDYKGNTPEGAAEYLEEYFLPYLKTVKVCSPIADCGIDYTEYKKLNGDALDSRDMKAGSTGAVLQDGAILVITHGADYYVLGVDINGKKGPNTLGKDFFRISGSSGIVNGKLEMIGQGYSRDELINPPAPDEANGCNIGVSGKYCLPLIMVDGWEIKDDYPW